MGCLSAEDSAATPLVWSAITARSGGDVGDLDANQWGRRCGGVKLTVVSVIESFAN